MTYADRIYEQVKELPEPLAREVLTFVEKICVVVRPMPMRAT